MNNICTFGLAALGLICTGCQGGAASNEQAPPPASPVVVAPIVQRDVNTRQTFVGTVMPKRKSVVGSAVDGRVLEVFVEEGDWVTANQPLIQLRTNTLEIELAAAEAELVRRRQVLAEMENGTRPEELAQAQARQRGAKARLDYAKARHERTRALFQQGRSVTQEEFDEAVASAVAAEQDYLVAQAAYELAVKGPRDEQVEQAKASVQTQQEEVRRIEDLIAKYTLRSPFDGYVVAEHTEVGAWINSADPAFDVVELDPVEISIAVPETYIVTLQERMAAARRARAVLTAEVKIDGLPGKVLTGRVERIVPEADLRSRTFPVKIRVENPRGGNGHLLKAGMLAWVSLTVGRQPAALLVPKDALVLGGQKPVVFVLERDAGSGAGQAAQAGDSGTVRRVAVETGVADGSLMQVIDLAGSLIAGQYVVVQGNERLRPPWRAQVTEVASPEPGAPYRGKK